MGFPLMMVLDPYGKSFNNYLCFPSVPNDHSDSGVCSPTLWRTSPPKSPLHRREDYWSLSPESKAQAIARGQRELMEIVSKMPESCYELSLKDLVEVKVNQENDRKVFDELPKRNNKPDKVLSKTMSIKRADPYRTGGVNNSGFLLNILFPVSLRSKKDATRKKKKKREEGSKVSPRPSISDEFVKADDKDWWNRLSESSTKRSGSSSSSNGSNRNGGSLRDEKRSCLSFPWCVFKSIIQSVRSRV